MGVSSVFCPTQFTRLDVLRGDFPKTVTSLREVRGAKIDVFDLFGKALDLLDGGDKIAIFADEEGGVILIVKGVDQEVRGDVNVHAFLCMHRITACLIALAARKAFFAFDQATEPEIEEVNLPEDGKKSLLSGIAFLIFLLTDRGRIEEDFDQAAAIAGEDFGELSDINGDRFPLAYKGLDAVVQVASVNEDVHPFRAFLGMCHGQPVKKNPAVSEERAGS